MTELDWQLICLNQKSFHILPDYSTFSHSLSRISFRNPYPHIFLDVFTYPSTASEPLIFSHIHLWPPIATCSLTYSSKASYNVTKPHVVLALLWCQLVEATGSRGSFSADSSLSGGRCFSSWLLLYSSSQISNVKAGIFDKIWNLKNYHKAWMLIIWYIKVQQKIEKPLRSEKFFLLQF